MWQFRQLTSHPPSLSLSVCSFLRFVSLREFCLSLSHFRVFIIIIILRCFVLVRSASVPPLSLSFRLQQSLFSVFICCPLLLFSFWRLFFHRQSTRDNTEILFKMADHGIGFTLRSCLPWCPPIVFGCLLPNPKCDAM